MKFIDSQTLENNKEITELDKLVFKFIRILEKYVDYVVISGYVAILLGRSRSTEDVDLFIREISLAQFTSLHHELTDNGFWCLQGNEPDTLYGYLKERLAIRYGYESAIIPNMEIKVAWKDINKESFNERLKVCTKSGPIFISSLERQIAFKRHYLCSKKDIEDAMHIEDTFKGHIDLNRVKEYKTLIDHELAETREKQSGR